jgi:hypothetical protein
MMVNWKDLAMISMGDARVQLCLFLVGVLNNPLETSLN